MEEKIKMITDHKEVEKIKPESYMGMTTYYVYLKSGSFIVITDVLLSHLTPEKLDEMVTSELRNIHL